MNKEPKDQLPSNYVNPAEPQVETPLDPELTEEEAELLKRKLAELRKRDPFIYR